MVMEIVIAAFVVGSLHDVAVHGSSPVGGVYGWVMALAPIAVLIAAQGLWMRVLGRRIDEHGDGRAVVTAERLVSLSRWLALAVHAANVIGLGWVSTVRGAVGDQVMVDEIIVASPVLVTILAGWWWFYPIERRLREAVMVRQLEEGVPVHAPPTRLGYVWFQARHQMLVALLPVTLVGTWGEALPRVWERMGLSESGWIFGVQVLGIIVLLSLIPIALRWLWDTVPMEDGPVRAMLAEVCTRNRVRVGNLLVWRTRGTLYNAAVMGMLGKLRFIMVTDALLERMPEEELEAVASHEVAHVRRHHLVWLALATLSVVAGVSMAGSYAGEAVFTRVSEGWSREQTRDAMELAALGVGVAALIAGVLTLGFVSRRFEWQADAQAASDLSSSRPGWGGRVDSAAAQTMIGALSRVAALNGLPIRKFTWRHGSIATRQRKLHDLVGVPAGELPIDRAVGRIKIATVVFLSAVAITAVWRPELAGF